MEGDFDVTVVGAGVNGLMATYHLSKNQNLKVLLLQQFDIGHINGSSHSQIRIIRSAYRDPLYVQLTLEAKNKYWPQLQAHLGKKFINNNPFIVFGDYQPMFNQYKSLIGTKGFQNLQIITGEQAQQKYPQMKLGHLKQVIEDTNAGVVEARNALSSVVEYLKAQPNVTIKSNTKLLRFKSENRKVSLQIQNNNEKTNIVSKKLLVTPGRWVCDLFPDLKKDISINEQLITYLQFQGPIQNFQMGKFPTWMSFDQNHRQFWSLPSFGQDAIKFGRHLNLMSGEAPSKEQRLIQMRQFAQKCFKRPIKNIQKDQVCYYTSTVAQDFIIEFMDEDKNILLGSICSGHAFKFGPVTGFILSELILNGKSTVNVFQNKIHQFSIQHARKNQNKSN